MRLGTNRLPSSFLSPSRCQFTSKVPSLGAKSDRYTRPILSSSAPDFVRDNIKVIVGVKGDKSDRYTMPISEHHLSQTIGRPISDNILSRIDKRLRLSGFVSDRNCGSYSSISNVPYDGLLSLARPAVWE